MLEDIPCYGEIQSNTSQGTFSSIKVNVRTPAEFGKSQGGNVHTSLLLR